MEIPYSCQTIDKSDVDAVLEALQSKFLTQGPCIPEFEKHFASFHCVRYAVAVMNATAALHLGCLALGAGPGKRVWTSPNSFVASANCALYCGAQVDFVDIDPLTRNMSVDLLRERLINAEKIGVLPDIVIPVDFAGFPCDLREIRDLANIYNFKILQDASHATGARYLGAPVGSGFADATVFSFHAVKIVTTGEGGMITTNDCEVAEKLRLLRSHGITRDSSSLVGASHGPWYYEQISLGFNYRITDFQAALGISQMERLDSLQVRRASFADRYNSLLSSLPLILPVQKSDRVSSWHLYVVEVKSSETRVLRSAIISRLREAGIGVNVHYIPIHTQPYYRCLGFSPGDFPLSEAYYDRALSLPLFPSMSESQQDYVVDILTRLF